MLTEDGGLEKSVASSNVNFQAIPLDKLAVSPNLFLPINKSKVNEIAESIDDRKDAICNFQEFLVTFIIKGFAFKLNKWFIN